MITKKEIIKKFFKDDPKYSQALLNNQDFLRTTDHQVPNTKNSNQIIQKAGEEPESIAIRNRRKAYSIDLSKKKTKISLYGQITEDDFYSLKHPESKIIPLSQSYGQLQQVSKILGEQNKHKVRALDKKPADYKLRFFHVYSSGPNDLKQGDLQATKDVRLNAAIIIQKCW